MSYEIASFATSFTPSIFPRKFRPFQELTLTGAGIPLPQYSSIPHYIRKVYGVSEVTGFKGNFNFLDRANKEKIYDPRLTDPFVFSGPKSLTEFKADGFELLQVLTKQWKALGLPTTRDSDRSIEVPDSQVMLTDMLANGSKSKYAKLYIEHREAIAHITSDVDIAKKLCIVRSVNHGWWVVSYSGNRSQGLSHFKGGLEVFERTIKVLLKSANFKKRYDETFSLQGDPLDTLVGFDSFASLVDDTGAPTSKLLILDKFKGIGTAASWGDYLKAVSDKTTDTILKRYPLAVPSIIRKQAGYKWQHTWKLTSGGLATHMDTRGDATNRVAFAAAYLQNLPLSPIQTQWKTLRKMMPGMFHDGKSWGATLNQLKNDNPFVLESDYKNYDRTIPTDLSAAISWIYAKTTPNPEYYFSLLMGTQKDVSMFWSDWIPGSQGRGWLFTPPSVALLSGLKITSEIGSFVNLIVVCQSLLDSGLETVDSLVSYMTPAATSSDGHVPVTHKRKFLIQSDDTQFISSDLDELMVWAKAFGVTVGKAGMKSELELGDRFLMRHMLKGVDRPIATRVFQNTLSNEEPSTDHLKFLVGLVSRTDGFLGLKSIDPFNTGKVTSITDDERVYSTLILTKLYKYLSTAAAPVPNAVYFLEVLLLIASRMTQRNGTWSCSMEDHREITALREKAIAALATRELDIAADESKAYSTYIGQLHKNSYSPANQLILDHIAAMNPQTSSIINQLQAKEHSFYLYAMKQLNLKLHVA